MTQELKYRDFVQGIAGLGIDPDRPIIAHASLSAFKSVRGGAETVVGALVSSFSGVMMPTFTYRTMIIPETGPPQNGIYYGSGKNRNKLAEFFYDDLPADRLMGAIPETLRMQTGAVRSSHPILSFSGIGVQPYLERQSLANPLAPIEQLVEAGSWVLLLGVNHTVNTSLHLAEKLAGRKQFLRWALTPTGIKACPGFPACSNGFEALAPALEGTGRKIRIGPAAVHAFPLRRMVTIARGLFHANPAKYFCSQIDCPRCNASRTVQRRVRV